MNDRILLSLYYYYNEELHCCGFLTSIVRAVKICLVAVDGNIQAFRIRVRVDGNFRKLVDDFNQDKSDNERVHGNATRRQKLDTKLLATRVDATGNFVRGKDTNADGAQETAHTVHGPDVQSVIEFVPLRNLDATIAKRHAQETNQQRRPRVDEASRWGNRSQTGDGSDARADQSRFTFQKPFNHHPPKERRGCGDFRVDRGISCLIVRGERGSTIETKPTEPEQASTECDERNVVWLILHASVQVVSRRQGNDRRQRGKPSGHVNHDSTGKIPDALFGHPATAPNPVTDREIHQVRPERDEDHVRSKVHAIGKGSSHQRRSDHREHPLKPTKHESGNSPLRRVVVRILQEIMRLRVPDEIALAFSKAQGVTPSYPNYGEQTHTGIILRHDG